MRIYLAIIILSLLACQKEQLRSNAIILGHAGSGTDVANSQLAENTFSSLRKALEVYNLDGVEFDIQFTADYHPVIFHNRYLEPLSSGQGQVFERDLSYVLEQCWRDKSTLHSDKLMSLDSFLSYVSAKFGSDKYLSINLKNYNPLIDLDSAASVIDYLLKRYDLQSKSFIESDNEQFLDFVEAKDSNTLTLFSREIGESALKVLLDKNYDGVIDYFYEADLEWIGKIQEAQKLVVCYGQRLHKDFSAASTLMADIIQVDNPILAQRSRN